MSLLIWVYCDHRPTGQESSSLANLSTPTLLLHWQLDLPCLCLAIPLFSTCQQDSSSYLYLSILPMPILLTYHSFPHVYAKWQIYPFQICQSQSILIISPWMTPFMYTVFWPNPSIPVRHLSLGLVSGRWWSQCVEVYMPCSLVNKKVSTCRERYGTLWSFRSGLRAEKHHYIATQCSDPI